MPTRPAGERIELNRVGVRDVPSGVVHLQARVASWSERRLKLAHLPGRSLAVAGALAMLGMIALGPSAVAEVNISPAQAEQGGAAEVTLQVRNDRPGVWTTKVEVQLPPETPIGEVYPMSVPGWAPVSTSRELDTPIDGLHNSGLTSVTSAITWIRSDDAPKPPEVENLVIQLGPLPTVNELVLTVIQTYSDGKTQRWSGPTPAGAGVAAGPGTVLRLTPPAAAGESEATQPDAAAPAAPGQGRTLAQLGLIGAGIVGGVLISAFVMVTIGSKSRARKSGESPAEEKADVVA